jgi:hypothetical protein
MIGRDIQIEAAASRPYIVRWISRGTLFFSICLLAASIVTASSVVRQMMAKSTIYAIKPAGGYFEIGGYSKNNEAQMASVRANSDKGLNQSPNENRRAR